MTSAIQNIASVSGTQSASTEQVSASTQEMSAQVEQMSTQAQELATTASQLQSLVAHFTLGDEIPCRAAARKAETARPIAASGLTETQSSVLSPRSAGCAGLGSQGRRGEDRDQRVQQQGQLGGHE